MILTPIKNKVDMTLDIDNDNLEYIKKLAKETNSTVEEIISHFLIDMVSKEIDIADIGSLSEKELKSAPFIITKDRNPIARITPV